jgi:hypothetical protein
MSWDRYLLAVAVALAAGGAAGAVWGTAWRTLYQWDIIAVFLWIGTGYLIGRAVSLTVRRRWDPYLVPIAAAGPVLAYAVSLVVFNSTHIFNASVFDVVRLFGVLLAVLAAVGSVRA